MQIICLGLKLTVLLVASSQFTFASPIKYNQAIHSKTLTNKQNGSLSRRQINLPINLPIDIPILSGGGKKGSNGSDGNGDDDDGKAKGSLLVPLGLPLAGGAPAAPMLPQIPPPLILATTGNVEADNDD